MGIAIFLSVIILLIGLAILIFKKGYFIVPPNEAVIIVGMSLKNNSKEQLTKRVITDGAGFYIPFFQKLEHITLEQMSVDISTEDENVETLDCQSVAVNCNYKIKVDISNPAAFTNFLNKDKKEIVNMVKKPLQGILRETISQNSLENLVIGRSNFAKMMQEQAQITVQPMGVQIVVCKVLTINDSNGIIESKGKILAIEIKKNLQLTQAAATEEANRAKVEADIKIAEQNARLFEAQQQQTMIKDQAKAETTLAYLQRKKEILELENSLTQLEEEGATVIPARVQAEAQMLETDALADRITKFAAAKKDRGETEIAEMLMKELPNILAAVKMPGNMTVIAGSDENKSLPLATSMATVDQIAKTTLGRNIPEIISSIGTGK